MGRKKKNKDNLIEIPSGSGNSNVKINITGDAKRSAAAVFLFALALVITLGFFEQSGILGRNINKIIGLFMGWTKFLFPLFLLASGVILLYRKETSFYITKLIGLTVSFFSITGFLHWFYEIKEMNVAAGNGLGGGYIGYALAYLLVKYLGEAGSLVIIFSLFLIGVIVAFNFSIVSLIERLKRKEVLSEEDQKAILPVEGEQEAFPSEENKKEEEKKEEPVDPENNISKIEFVEGPDQYVSKNLRSDYISPGPSETKKASSDFDEERYLRKRNRKNKWNFPPFDLLEESSGVAKGGDVEKNAEIIEKTLRNFGIEVERGEIKTGPSVTQYSFRPAVGIKIAKILSLQNDLALALAAHPIRIEAPIPGKSLIGIEVPNKVSATVRLREMLESRDFKGRKSSLTLTLGQDVSGNFVFADLAKMPHLLIAGATGTGKSVGINAVITTLLYQNSPEDLRFIMVDPKRVELSQYNDIPHLLCKVVVENSKVVNVLKWAVGEMERRYRLLQEVGSRDLISYKEKLNQGTKKKYTHPETGEVIEEDLENLPYIVIIIDELADLMGSHGKEVEGAIVRIAQMARAVGMHLIVSTQRPSVEVITGLIKANITTRIAFQVATQIDSRTIIDMGGSEKLLGNGDLLFLSSASPKPKRIQGAYVSESEVKRVVRFIKDQKTEKLEKEESIAEVSKGEEISEFKEKGENQGDDLFNAAKEEVIRSKKASASLLQRRLRVGYARAARLLDLLEEEGIIGPADGAKPREVYLEGKGEVNINYDDDLADQEKRDKWQM